MLLVAAALCACGGDDKPKTTANAGRGGGGVSEDRDAGKPDAAESGGAGGDVAQPSELGGEGGGGSPAAPGGGSGGMAAGGSGGSRPPEPQPEGGAGGLPAQPQGGSPAPQERVLWSQDWTVEVHEAVAYGAVAGTKMGLILDAGPQCRFGLAAADSGTSQEYETDGKCITAFSAPMGAAGFFTPSGMADSTAGRRDLMGWKEAVQERTVLRLRRTQTYEIQQFGSGGNAWNYADFSGKWEAIGY